VKDWLHRNSRFLLITGLVCLYILSVLLNLGHLNLKIEEPRRTIISIEMLETGNYIHPHTLGWDYYNKPPFFNWVLAVFMKITGSDSEFIARLPSLFFLLIFGAIHYLVAKRFLDKTTAALSAFFIITSADLFFYTLSNGAEIDIFYSFIVYLQVISMFWYAEQKKYLFLFLFSWFFCAVGFLTKGYPSLVFQVLTLAAICVYSKSFRIVFKVQHLAGILIFLIITGSYFYIYSRNKSPVIMWVNLLNESFLKSAIGKESIGKFYKIFIYPYALFKVLSPWCLFLLLVFNKQRVHLFDNRLVRFSILFILFNIGVYWITGAQKTRYIYMFIPFFMIVTSYVYQQWEKQYPVKINHFLKYAGILFCLSLVALLGLPFFLKVSLWKILFFGSLLFIFIILFFRLHQYRIWLFIIGFIFLRLIYAEIGIPLKRQREFDYKSLVNGMSSKNNNQRVYFWGKQDELYVNIIVGDTIYKWKGKPVLILPPRLSYQVPYYFYRATGSLVMYDSTLETGKTYISYNYYLKNRDVERISSIYDKQLNDSLVMFRIKPEQGKQ
jgi:4-amino-4-deoxy-L-arabinose transferase-like glycosyltransferase